MSKASFEPTNVNSKKPNVNVMPSSRSSVTNSNALNQQTTSLPLGWKREEALKPTELYAGKTDIYYTSPTGQKVRCKAEMQEIIGGSYDVSNFDWHSGKFVNCRERSSANDGDGTSCNCEDELPIIETTRPDSRVNNEAVVGSESHEIPKQNETVIEEVPDCSAGKYGDEEYDITKVSYTSINLIDETYVSQNVSITGFLQQVRQTGKQAFVVVRSRISTIQCVAGVGEKVSKNMINFIANIPKESVVNIQGSIVLVEKPVESCSQSNVEIQIESLKVRSRCKSRLPLQIEDATRPENDKNLAKVNLDTRLNNRVLELRTVTNQAIMSLRGGVLNYFSTYLISRGFVPISSPCIISAASEGGSNVFEVAYFGKKAYLAQSPQLYKQMCIAAGMKKVFAIGPVFRAENSNTHRHLTEFIGLDMEMQFHHHYHEVLHTICETLVHIFKELQTNYSKEIACIRKQFDAEPFEYLEPTLILTFAEGVAMLNEAGIEMNEHEDLSTTNEKILGKLIKKKFSTDFYVLDKFPLSVRPFYTMPDKDYPGFSNSYDVFMRGEEIMSGAQRIHHAAKLRESAMKHGINLETIKDYLEAFEYACPPHAGGGIGLERVVMLFLGLDNIRRVSMFPRDPNRLCP